MKKKDVLLVKSLIDDLRQIQLDHEKCREEFSKRVSMIVNIELPLLKKAEEILNATTARMVRMISTLYNSSSELKDLQNSNIQCSVNTIGTLVNRYKEKELKKIKKKIRRKYDYKNRG